MKARFDWFKFVLAISLIALSVALQGYSGIVRRQRETILATTTALARMNDATKEYGRRAFDCGVQWGYLADQARDESITNMGQLADLAWSMREANLAKLTNLARVVSIEYFEKPK